jgi:hypothetical protein
LRNHFPPEKDIRDTVGIGVVLAGNGQCDPAEKRDIDQARSALYSSSHQKGGFPSLVFEP